MELNILNSKLNVDANLFHEKTEEQFWYLYCQLLNLRKPVLSDKDCSILSIILTYTKPDLSILEKENGKELERLTKTPLSNLYTKCKQLTEKGFLIKNEDGYFINPAFKSFQKYVKSNNNVEIKFIVPIKIIENGIVST